MHLSSQYFCSQTLNTIAVCAVLSLFFKERSQVFSRVVRFPAKVGENRVVPISILGYPDYSDQNFEEKC
jgi:hypothetical protein